MIRIIYVTHDGREQAIEAREGLSLMENAIANGIDGIDAVCGGNAYCGTCRVYVDPDWRGAVGEPTEIEFPMFEANDDHTPGIRLACQIPITPALDGLVVKTPESQS